jgi:hypothetical protein
MNAREFPTDGIWCIPVRSPRRAGDCAGRLLLVARPSNYGPSGAVSVVWLGRACSSCRCPSRLRAARFPLARVVTRASRWPSLAGRRFRRSEEEAASITSLVCGTAPGFAKVGRDSADWPGSGRMLGQNLIRGMGATQEYFQSSSDFTISEQIRSEFERRRTRTSTRRTIRLFLRSSDRRPVTIRWPRVYGDLKQRNHARTPKAWDRFLRFGSSPFSHLTDGMIDEGELSTDATGNGRAGTDGR